MSGGRSIKKLVQLVTIDNNFPLSSRLSIQKGISMGFSLGEFTADPSKNIYMTQDGFCRSFSTNEERQVYYFIQKINFFFMNNTNTDMLFNFRDCIFPKRLYTKFIELENKKELEELISKKIIGKEYGFCVFPNELEKKQLEKKYRETKLKEFSNYCIAHKVEYIESKKKINDIVQDVIKKVNIDFIWGKQQQMKDFVKRYSSGNIPEDKLLWLNEQLENVSEILMNKENYLWKKVEEGVTGKNDHWDIEKTYGEKNMKNALLVPAYRIYSHYALCCLEIFLDIQDRLPYFVCEKCKNLVYTGKKTRRRSCSRKENEKCFKEQQNERQKKRYQKNKIINRT